MDLRSSSEAGWPTVPEAEAWPWDCWAGRGGRGPGWRGCRPRAESTVIRKWPVKGGTSAEGRVSGSTCARLGGVEASRGGTYLVVNEPPLLEKRVYTHNGTDVASKIAAAGSDSKIFRRSHAIGVEHKVAVILVHRGGLAPVARVEKLGESALFDRVDGAHVEPDAVRGDYDVMRLRGQVALCLGAFLLHPHIRHRVRAHRSQGHV